MASTTYHLPTLLEQAGAPPREFWENELEIPAAQIIAEAVRPGVLARWVAARGNRQLALLRRLLSFGGLKPPADGSVPANGHAAVLPYLLVHEFSKYKSPAAVAEHAERVLPTDLLEACRKQSQDFDKTSLCFALYHHNPEELPLILCLDKVYKCGFARMRLRQKLRRPQQEFAEFLTPSAIGEVLSAFDRGQVDDRVSELKRILVVEDRPLVFIRRGERPGKILQQGRVVHGYVPEWIVLEFFDSAKRVSIASKSVAGPLKIANRIASAYFGGECSYDNENLLTYREQLKRLMEELQKDRSPQLRLVEFVRANSPLDSAPELRMAGVDELSLGPAIEHFNGTIGKLLEDVEQVESVKVVFCRKRVTLRFERTDRVDEAFVVRYSDQRLSPTERRQFEEYLSEQHGITALSVEKRFCNAA